MKIRSILVNVDLDDPRSAAVAYAIELAVRLDAGLIGVAAEEPNTGLIAGSEGGSALDFYTTIRSDIGERLQAAEDSFRESVPTTVRWEWHGFVGNPTRSMLESATQADIIILGTSPKPAFQAPAKVDAGDLLLASGKPVLVVASGAKRSGGERIAIGWKDTREARRAVADAMPLLELAAEVKVYSVSEGDPPAERRSLDDITAWLFMHDVKATGVLIQAEGPGASALTDTAVAAGADLLVTGGYGHSRTREWLFGGVTRDLLATSSMHRLFSN